VFLDILQFEQLEFFPPAQLVFALLDLLLGLVLDDLQQVAVHVEDVFVQFVLPFLRRVFFDNALLLVAQTLDDAPQVLLVLLSLGHEFVVLRLEFVVLDRVHGRV